MVDVSQYKKIAEFRDGSLHWLSDDIKNIVYIMVFGEDYYIGSTREIRRRFSQYVPALKHGKYHAKRLQTAFDRVGQFDVYKIEGRVPLRTLREREDYYLNELKPTLNARLYADALISDLFPKPTKRELEKRKRKRRKKISKPNRVKNVRNNTEGEKISKPNRVKNVRNNTEGEIIKGIQTYIPIPDYLRLCRIKIQTGKTISELFAQALMWYLDKCEAKK